MVRLEVAIVGAVLAIVVGFIARAGLQAPVLPSEKEILSQGVQIFKLPDGRILEYWDSAPLDPSSVVLLALHGEFGTGLCYKDMPTVYKGVFRDVRVIAPTWPGFGGSTPNPDETLLGFAREIKLVLESLNVAKFMLIGSSWGGAFALAVAQVMPERVLAVGLLAPALPALHEFPGWTSYVQETIPRFVHQHVLGTPVLCQAAVRLLRPVLQADYSQAKYERMLGSDPAGTLFEQPAVILRGLDHCLASSVRWFVEGQCRLAQLASTRGPQLDLPAIGRSFAVNKIPVYMWTGANDTLVTRPNQEHIVKGLARGGFNSVNVQYVRDEGHMYVVVGFHAMVFKLRRNLKHTMM